MLKMLRRPQTILVDDTLLRESLEKLQRIEKILTDVTSNFNEIMVEVVGVHLRLQKAAGTNRGRVLPMSTNPNLDDPA